MKSPIVAAIAGIIFALGLAVSGMTDPRKIVAFLDVKRTSGGWDPSLAFVMLGALAIHVPLLRLAGRRPLLADAFAGPEPSRSESPGCSTPDQGVRKIIDSWLILGACVFGIGWGLSGYCPGPALVAAGSGSGGALVFVAAMMVGLFGARRVLGSRSPAA